MDINNLSITKIKELLSTPKQEDISKDLLTAVQNDERKGVQSLYKAYQRRIAERERVAKLYTYENECMERGYKLIAGVDEVGRGPLAGPVVVAAVILPPNCFIEKINDSKKLSENTREKLYDEIMNKAVAVSCAFVDEKTIDRVNIYQATMNGMYEAIYGLKPQPDMVLIDAMPLNKLDIACQSIVKGDAKSASIAAASIVAKVRRDRLMNDFAKVYPQYGFDSNKGYGTAEHVEALKKYGACKIHRCSFDPVKSLVNKNE